MSFIHENVKSGNDEYYTPKYAVKPIIEYIPKEYTIWCPFDTKKSNFVRGFKHFGYNVKYSHISEGYDFFETKCKCDCIISNPPYSIKKKVFKRLFELDKPFAMLVGIVGVFDSRFSFEMFRDNEFEIMYLYPRVCYTTPEGQTKSCPYQSAYICHNLLPEKIMFKEVKR